MSLQASSIQLNYVQEADINQNPFFEGGESETKEQTRNKYKTKIKSGGNDSSPLQADAGGTDNIEGVHFLDYMNNKNKKLTQKKNLIDQIQTGIVTAP